jgi:hypothetical protein
MLDQIPEGAHRLLHMEASPDFTLRRVVMASPYVGACMVHMLATRDQRQASSAAALLTGSLLSTSAQWPALATGTVARASHRAPHPPPRLACVRAAHQVVLHLSWEQHGTCIAPFVCTLTLTLLANLCCLNNVGWVSGPGSASCSAPTARYKPVPPPLPLGHRCAQS